jgi:hypothetical protein
MKLGSQTATITYEEKIISYSVTVTNQGASVGTETILSDLIISEYVEGSENNKAIELFNGTNSGVDLSNYSIKLFANGASTATSTLALSSTLAKGNTYVIVHASADTTLKAKANLTNLTIIQFNGDDALGLYNGSNLIDAFGRIGSDPGTQWGSGSVVTLDKTLVRKSSIISGDTNGSDAFDPSAEWDAYDVDTFSYLGSHAVDTPIITPQQQAEAFADYVMTGLGLNAAGSCSTVYEGLKTEYDYMDEASKTIFLTSSDETIVEARARYEYLSLFAEIGNEDTVTIRSQGSLNESSVFLYFMSAFVTCGLTVWFIIGKRRQNI